tara:strand:- start:50 stop:433 length:384 start_codon:yes stop_codon:yes gene_type:complete
MSVVVTVTETTGNTITVTTDEVIVTTNTLAVADAGQMLIVPPPGSDITATNVQDAIHQLADQKFTGGTAPTGADAHLDEGDLWYDTANNLLKVYRNTTWEDLVIAGQLAEGSAATEYADVTLNGGYF